MSKQRDVAGIFQPVPRRHAVRGAVTAAAGGGVGMHVPGSRGTENAATARGCGRQGVPSLHTGSSARGTSSGEGRRTRLAGRCTGVARLGDKCRGSPRRAPARSTGAGLLGEGRSVAWALTTCTASPSVLRSALLPCPGLAPSPASSLFQGAAVRRGLRRQSPRRGPADVPAAVHLLPLPLLRQRDPASGQHPRQHARMHAPSSPCPLRTQPTALPNPPTRHPPLLDTGLGQARARDDHAGLDGCGLVLEPDGDAVGQEHDVWKHVSLQGMGPGGACFADPVQEAPAAVHGVRAGPGFWRPSACQAQPAPLPQRPLPGHPSKAPTRSRGLARECMARSRL